MPSLGLFESSPELFAAQAVAPGQQFALHLRRLADNSTEQCRMPVVEETQVHWTDFVAIIVLATMSGLFSGLNLGLLGLDVKNLELLT